MMARVFDAPYTDVRSEPANPAEPAQAEPSRYSFLMSFVILFAVAIAGFFLVTTQNVSAAPEPVPANDYNQRIGYVEETDVPLELYQGAPVEHDTLPTPTLATPTEPPAVVTDVPVTPAPVVVATVDPAAIVAQAHAEAEAARLRADAEAYAQSVRDEAAKRSQATAWGWFWLGLAFSALAVTLVAATLGTVDKWRTHWRKDAQNSASEHRKAQDAQETPVDTNMLAKMPCSVNVFESWLGTVDAKTGKCPPEAAVQDLFGGQNEYRKFFYGWLVPNGYAEKAIREGWFLTQKFYALQHSGAQE